MITAAEIMGIPPIKRPKVRGMKRRHSLDMIGKIVEKKRARKRVEAKVRAGRDPERRKAARDLWRQRHPEQQRAAQTRWVEENRAYVSAYERARRARLRFAGLVA